MNNNELPSGELIVRYKKDMLNILQKLCPKLDLIDLEEGINYSISKHFKNQNALIDNNYTKRKYSI